jgi:hypothetical protein
MSLAKRAVAEPARPAGRSRIQALSSGRQRDNRHLIAGRDRLGDHPIANVVTGRGGGQDVAAGGQRGAGVLTGQQPEILGEFSGHERTKATGLFEVAARRRAVAGIALDTRQSEQGLHALGVALLGEDAVAAEKAGHQNMGRESGPAVMVFVRDAPSTSR